MRWTGREPGQAKAERLLAADDEPSTGEVVIAERARRLERGQALEVEVDELQAALARLLGA